jgi:hypothetical protein
MAGSDINEDLWKKTNNQLQIKGRKWQWIVRMLRKPNVAIENLAL